MAKVIGKEPLCSTDLKYFKAIQIIEGQTLFDRYKSAQATIDNYIDLKYRHFISYPVKEGDKITFHGKRYNETSQILSDLQGEEAAKYQRLKAETLDHYNSKIEELKNSGKTIEAKFLTAAIKYVDDRFVYCYDNTVVLGVWGMQLRENLREDIHEIRKDLTEVPPPLPPPPPPPLPPPPPSFTITYNAGDNGTLNGDAKIDKQQNEILTDSDIPQIEPKEGYEFTGWNIDPHGHKVTGDVQFIAQYREKEIIPPPPPPPPPPPFTITYNAGDNGTLNGDAKIDKQQNEILTDSDIPQIEPKEGYEFTGWNIDPHGHKVTGDVQFTAQYRKKVVEKKPWWKRFWLWFTRKGCLQWLLWLLLLLLLLLLLCWLLRSCDGPPPPKGNPYTPVPTPPGYEDVLPPQQGVLPPINDDDEAEIIPGNPTIIGNRLNILMENENKSIMDLAKAFKVKYPDDKYKVIYYDNVVKRMQITIPPEERERLKQEIPPAFAPEYELFVFDEALFESSYIPNDPAFYDSDKSWYLDAIHAPQAWDITRGSPKLTVAIVDNGFNLSHPELKRKVVMPYNVWTHSTGVFPQQVDHGTHVAGIALAIADNWKGICGIAPNCAFMPVQVADANERMTTTSVLDGILYALYQGADVVNVSLGGQFTGLDRYPESTQQDLIRNYFKEEERLWHEVMRIAAKHNSTIVVAAGNDNALAGIDPIQRPALAVTVSAVDKNNRNLNKADFSNYGYYSTISAPGVGIYSSIGENGYQMADGTSMAAPIVSGAIALMKSLNNSLTTQQIICILQNTGLKTQGNIGKLIQLDKALEMVKSGEKIDCTPLPSTGDVQILLSWNNYNDLDLRCIDPQGATVWFENPRTPSGGQLEFDMNVEYPYSKTPVENIYWQPGSAPNGTYNVYLIYYRQHEPAIDETPYHIKVKYGEKNEDYSGVIQRADNSIHICSFTLGTATNNPVNPIAAGIGQNQ